MGQFNAHIDAGKNVIYMAFVGSFSKEDMLATNEKTLNLIKELKPGFTVINDISQYTVSGPEAAELITIGGKNLLDRGMKRLIRIVGESAIAQMQFQRMSKQAGYQAHTVASLEEAERLLETEE
jgi:hypothetical protein